MKKMIVLATTIAAFALCFVSCGQKATTDTAAAKDSLECINDGHNSQNSLNWDGIYTGTIPCANCEGIAVSLTLNLDETYSLSYTYLGKGDQKPEITSGKFTWNAAGSVITLDAKNLPTHYKVGESQLWQLDLEGKIIEGELADNYILHKVPECESK